MDPDELARRLNVVEQQFPRRLRCNQCAKGSDEEAARGWQARVIEDEETPSAPIVVVYCPGCVGRLFGE